MVPLLAPSPPLDRGPTNRASGAERVMHAWLFLLPIGAAVLIPRLPLSLALGDLLLAPITLVGILAMTRRGSDASRTLKRAAPWMYLVLVGSVAGLAGVGVPSWALVDLAKNTTAVLSFFAIWHLLSTPRRARWMLRGFMVGAAMTAVLLILDSGPRASATFYHPNYPAHYLACSVVLAAAYPGIRRTQRVALVVLFIAGILATASFGGLAMVAVGTLVLLVGARRDSHSTAWGRAPRWARLLVVVAIAGIVGMLLPAFLSQRVGSEALTSERFDRSATTRADLYSDALGLITDYPTGVGPTGIKNRQLLVREGVPWESHSDPLAYLLERSVVGLVGLIGVWWTLYKVGRRFVMSRALFLMVLLSAMLRETLNYRHLWLALALSIAVDLRLYRDRALREHNRVAPTKGQGSERSSRTEVAVFPAGSQ